MSLSERRGVALVSSIFVLVILGAVVAGGYFVAARQFRIALAGPQGAKALYAAEAGIAAAMHGLDTMVLDSMAPGEQLSLGFGQLPTGDSHAADLWRIDEGQDGQTAFYLLTSVGRAQGPWGGRRQLGLMMRRRMADTLCCQAALAADVPVTIEAGALVSGLDSLPAGAAASGLCGGTSPGGQAGILSVDPNWVFQAPGASVDGLPPIEAAGPPGSGTQTDYWLAELADLADVRYAAGSVIRSIGPTVGPSGDCERLAPDNWGAPGLPNHPCADYMPIIHVPGDLRIEASGGGQGVLLVEGNLDLANGFDFQGIVLVGGRLATGGGGAGVLGGVRIGSAAQGAVQLAPGASLAFSACTVIRALRRSKLHLPQPLAQFSWFEILE